MISVEVVMAKDNTNNVDADIQQCKEDILRARDLIPPLGPKKQKPSKPKVQIEHQPEKTSAAAKPKPTEAHVSKDKVQVISKQQKPSPPGDITTTSKVKETAALQTQKVTATAKTEKIMPTRNASAMPKSQEQPEAKIPKFDLAEQIMAEQRKLIATRRKAPAPKTKPVDKRSGEGSIRHGSVDVEPELELSAHQGVLSCDALNIAQNRDAEQIIAQIVAEDIKRLYSAKQTQG